MTLPFCILFYLSQLIAVNVSIIIFLVVETIANYLKTAGPYVVVQNKFKHQENMPVQYIPP